MSSRPDDVRPFEVVFEARAIEDLRRRLEQARWPDPEVVEDWSQGIPLAEVRALAEHWASEYDMQRVPQALNASGSHMRAGIHFLHMPSTDPGAVPLLLTHGWPGSVLEFLDAAAALRDPGAHGRPDAPAFHVVIPSLPGYGYSHKPTVPRTGVREIAQAWTELMQALGYDRYLAQGGDWGSAVTQAIARHAPEHLLGIHLNLAMADPAALSDPGPDEVEQIQRLKRFQQTEAGYAAQQATKPQTLGYALTDSPIGLLAWIAEKLAAWADGEAALSPNQILDTVSLYWFTASAASAARLYWESFATELGAFDEISVPTGYTAFPGEMVNLTERWAKTRFTDLRHYGIAPRGGHFAAYEQPEIFVDELRATYRTITRD